MWRGLAKVRGGVSVGYKLVDFRKLVLSPRAHRSGACGSRGDESSGQGSAVVVPLGWRPLG